jgi:hypothetical protein
MKKTFYLFLVLVILAVVFASTAMAGGDKVRGENGQGSVSQVQIQDPPPFQ